MIDHYGRRIDYVRISITDRCNLRCIYCMPQDGVPEIAHPDILSYEEITRLVRLFSGLDFHHVRLTGGEPLVRKNWLGLIREIHELPGIETIGITTNGMLLKGHAAEAKAAGLTHVNISLDTLDPDTFRSVTRYGDLNEVLDAVYESVECGLKVKLNAVPIMGSNDRELVPIAKLAKDHPIDVRFIELMPVGLGASMTPIPNDTVIAMMEQAFGTLAEDPSVHGFGPAKYMKPEGFEGSIGFISALSHEFCNSCNRVRITSDGRLKLCLNHQSGMDLRTLLRSGISDEEITQRMADCIEHKPERHGFLQDVSDREIKRMNQIGG